MKFQSSFLWLVLGSLAACRGPHDTEPPGPAPSLESELPPSALSGAVRALETLAAVRPADSLTQVRALECDTRHDPGSQRSFVRIFLALTVYAPTLERAEAAFAEIRAALETEAGAGGADRARLRGTRVARAGRTRLGSRGA